MAAFHEPSRTEKIRENSLASWSAVASPRDTAFGRRLIYKWANDASKWSDSQKRCHPDPSGHSKTQAPKPKVYGPNGFVKFERVLMNRSVLVLRV